LLFFDDVSCLIHGSCLDKVFMDIHSYIECTHNGISPPFVAYLGAETTGTYSCSDGTY
jgi:hypothetical protein